MVRECPFCHRQAIDKKGDSLVCERGHYWPDPDGQPTPGRQVTHSGQVEQSAGYETRGCQHRGVLVAGTCQSCGGKTLACPFCGHQFSGPKEIMAR